MAIYFMSTEFKQNWGAEQIELFCGLVHLYNKTLNPWQIMCGVDNFKKLNSF